MMATAGVHSLRANNKFKMIKTLISVKINIHF